MNLLYLVTRPRPFFNNQVTGLRNRGHTIDIVEVPGRESQDETRSIIDYLRFYPKVISKSINSYDLVHANFGNTLPFAVCQPQRPLVVTYWGTDLNGRIGSMTKSFTQFADEVILPSPIMANKFEGDHVIIPFGIDTELFKPIHKKNARRKLGWDDDSNIALFPYTPSREEKNYELAERVIEKSEHQIELKVVFDADYSRIPLYMNASDFILITSDEESGPMVAKEAVACNVPVLSTDVGFVQEVLNDVSYSSVCDSIPQFTNQIDDIISNERRSDGRKKAMSWNKETMGDQLERLYESLV